MPFAGRPIGGGVPLLASRGCPEFCTYCPHRILAGHRSRSVGNILDELSFVTSTYSRPYVVFRDPLFTQERDRVLDLCDGILVPTPHPASARRVSTPDPDLLSTMSEGGLRAISFGVEAMSPAILRRVGGGRSEASSSWSSITADRSASRTAAFYVIDSSKTTGTQWA
jgi:radical SAM superfamily enzyme YgiQ (UPF0313 family)